jgi:putative ABC transport system ATP-binding protein
MTPAAASAPIVLRTMTPATASVPVVRLTQVKKNYRAGETKVLTLRGVSRDVGASEMLALTGPSGSGKSTLLNLAA